jgi:hypothetical protein
MIIFDLALFGYMVGIPLILYPLYYTRCESPAFPSLSFFFTGHPHLRQVGHQLGLPHAPRLMRLHGGCVELVPQMFHIERLSRTKHGTLCNSFPLLLVTASFSSPTCRGVLALRA